MEMECKKCKSRGSILLRKRDAYCEECFMAGTNHKFRSTLGKNRAIKPEEKVLVAISEGISSAVLLDLVHSSVNLDNHKKLLLAPYFLYIMGLTNDGALESHFALDLITKCNGKGFDLYILHVSDAKTEIENVLPNILPVLDQAKVSTYKSEIENLTRTEYNDFVQIITRELLIKIAECLNCDVVFTAETTATLAANLLSNIAMGRGSQLEHDVGFMDSRNEKVKILRPMKDITLEELNYYCQIKQLEPYGVTQKSETSIQSLINKFVKNLDGDYPATVSTVCKTADKIGLVAQSNVKNKRDCCSLCESPLAGGEKFTALEATKFSKMMCTGETKFDSVKDTLCYSCSKFNTKYFRQLLFSI